MTTQAPVNQTETFAEVFNAICDNIEVTIRGKRDVVHLVVLSLIAEGHILLEDAPGVGKTSIGKALAASINATFGRVQFTPDLLPADVVGMTVWNRATGGFDFRPGPVFSNIVLADEINRASPKTQSALLEAMGERQVTVDGVTHHLAAPFMVIATQNPIEHEGTYPLPESQLDRFLMKITVGYPGRTAELEILEREKGVPKETILDALANAQPREVLLVGVEHEPHRGEIADFEEPGLSFGLVFVKLLALVDVARDDGAGHRRTQIDHRGRFERVLENVDFLGGEAEVEQPLARGGALGKSERGAAGLDALDEFALRREHLGAVDDGERLALFHLGADEVDEKFFDAAGDARGDVAVTRVVVVDHAGDA